MILRKSREFTVNMGNYESVKIGASVELDSEKHTTTYSSDLNVEADCVLDAAIRKDLEEAAELTETRNSFVLAWDDSTYYKKAKGK